MVRPAVLPLAALMAACAAPPVPASEPPIPVTRPAEGPGGRPNTEAEWAMAAIRQRADILAAANAPPEVKARFAEMVDCARYASDYSTRRIVDDINAGRSRDEACEASYSSAYTAFEAEADAALPLADMARFQYWNSGWVLDRHEFRLVGDAAAQRAYLQQKIEACFAAPDLPPGLSASLLTSCPMAVSGDAIAK